jgi:general secretion pathway protein M
MSVRSTLAFEAMMRERFQRWYEAQTPRDQRVLRLGSVAVAIIMVLGLLLVLQNRVSRAESRLAARKADLTWMQSVAPTLIGAGPVAAAVVAGESLVVLIDRSARESGLGQAIVGSQPSGKDAMRVQFDQADFNLLTAWLSRLTSQHGVQVESATFSSGTGPGMTNAVIVLRAGTG